MNQVFYTGVASSHIHEQQQTAIIRGDKAKEIHLWMTLDDYRTGKDAFGPFPVRVNQIPDRSTCHRALPSVWMMGMVSTEKRPLHQATLFPGSGCRRKMWLNTEMQPTYKLSHFVDGDPQLVLAEDFDGIPDVTEFPMTLVREDSEVLFFPIIPDSARPDRPEPRRPPPTPPSRRQSSSSTTRPPSTPRSTSRRRTASESASGGNSDKASVPSILSDVPSLSDQSINIEDILDMQERGEKMKQLATQELQRRQQLKKQEEERLRQEEEDNQQAGPSTERPKHSKTMEPRRKTVYKDTPPNSEDSPDTPVKAYEKDDDYKPGRPGDAKRKAKRSPPGKQTGAKKRAKTPVKQKVDHQQPTLSLSPTGGVLMVPPEQRPSPAYDMIQERIAGSIQASLSGPTTRARLMRETPPPLARSRSASGASGTSGEVSLPSPPQLTAEPPAGERPKSQQERCRTVTPTLRPEFRRGSKTPEEENQPILPGPSTEDSIYEPDRSLEQQEPSMPTLSPQTGGLAALPIEVQNLLKRPSIRVTASPGESLITGGEPATPTSTPLTISDPATGAVIFPKQEQEETPDLTEDEKKKREEAYQRIIQQRERQLKLAATRETETPIKQEEITISPDTSRASLTEPTDVILSDHELSSSGRSGTPNLQTPDWTEFIQNNPGFRLEIDSIELARRNIARRHIKQERQEADEQSDPHTPTGPVMSNVRSLQQHDDVMIVIDSEESLEEKEEGDGDEGTETQGGGDNGGAQL